MNNSGIKYNSVQSELQREIFFISDAHIGSRDKEAEALKEKKLTHFFEFLITRNPAPILYIVGDLFDFWFEYRLAIPAIYQKLLARLVHIIDQGVAIRYVTGNHDFWTQDFFQKYLNIDVYHGIHTLKVEDKSFFIFHGDGVIKNDRSYRLLKRIIQNPIIIRMYQLIHPDIGIPIARLASSMSRDYYQNDPEKDRWEDEKYLDYAIQTLKKSYDFVLLGHSHRPVAVTNGTKQYINLGDWMQHFTFAVYHQQSLKLYRFSESVKINGLNSFQEIKPTQITI